MTNDLRRMAAELQERILDGEPFEHFALALANEILALWPPGARAPCGYVTPEGFVRVPDDVRKALGLEQGGGVAFVQEKDGHFCMLTDAQLVDLAATTTRARRSTR